MTEFIKGGRGKKAPYETTHYRVPEPCKNTVELVCKTWKHLVSNEGVDSDSVKNLVTAIENVATMHYIQQFDKPVNGYVYKPVTEFEEATKPGNELEKLLTEALNTDGRSVKKIKEKITEALLILQGNNNCE